MRISGLITLSLLLIVSFNAFAQEFETVAIEEEKSDVSSSKTNLSYFDGLLLGLVEGITEYLPISSTGHLILTNKLLALDQATHLFDGEGNPITHHDVNPQTGAPYPFTLEDAANGYAIIIQAGAIAAVLIIYWQRVLIILMGFLGRSREGFLLGRNLIVAFIPAAILGLLLDDLIEGYLFGPYPVIAALIAGAFLMFYVEAQKKKSAANSILFQTSQENDLHLLTIRNCLVIGLLQCVAMWPGTSRSMMTIVGGYWVGLSPKRAAEFSFLLGLITLTAASGYKTLTLGPNMLKALDLGPVLFGIFVATLSAALAVKWLVNYLNQHGLSIFAWYRLGLAAIFTLFMTFL